MAGQALGTLGTGQAQTKPFDILLGGTYIHNSKTFLADVTQGSEKASFEIEA